MHYYKRNLGDYAKKAGRLSMLQHGSYTLLIDSCYDREQFPTLAEAIEWTWASTKEEVEAVEFVLRRFFTLEGDVYVQKRVQEEIAEYHAKSDTNKRIAIERETKRKENSTKRGRSVNEGCNAGNEAPPNQEPRTKNQEPVTNKKEKAKTEATAAPLNFYETSDSVVSDFVKMRNKKKAEVTQTAIDGIKSTAEAAGYSLENALKICCERGWQGFNPAWVKGGSFGKPSAHTGFGERNYAEGVAADGSF